MAEIAINPVPRVTVNRNHFPDFLLRCPAILYCSCVFIKLSFLESICVFSLILEKNYMVYKILLSLPLPLTENSDFGIK